MIILESAAPTQAGGAGPKDGIELAALRGWHAAWREEMGSAPHPIEPVGAAAKGPA